MSISKTITDSTPPQSLHVSPAFGARRDRLRFEHQMSAEEYTRAVVIPAWKKKQQDKPQPSEIDLTLKEFFESRGFRDSVKNRAAVNQYMREHNLEDYSLENLAHAIETLSDHLGLELSEASKNLHSRSKSRPSSQTYKNRSKSPRSRTSTLGRRVRRADQKNSVDS